MNARPPVPVSLPPGERGPDTDIVDVTDMVRPQDFVVTMWLTTLPRRWGGRHPDARVQPVIWVMRDVAERIH